MPWSDALELVPPSSSSSCDATSTALTSLVSLDRFTTDTADPGRDTFRLEPLAGSSFPAPDVMSAAFIVPLLSENDVSRSKPWRSSAPTLALSLASLLVAGNAAFVEPNRLQVREHRLAFEAWPADAEPIRIVHVSDLQTVGECEREREAARRINALEPDFVVFTGDYAAGPFGAEPCPAIAAARKFLSELEPRIATIVVMGHSETEWERSQIFDGLDLTYLVNETETFELSGGRALWFLGLHSWHGRENYRPLTSPREPGALRVVVSHVPDVTTRMEDRDLDLHLAGHTHGGQIVVPFFGPPITLSRLPRRYARGLHRFGDHWLNVCAGLGMEGNHAPRIRFLCPPEIVLLELVGEE